MRKQLRGRAIVIAVSTALAGAVVGTAGVAVADDWHGGRDKVDSGKHKDQADGDHRDRADGDREVVRAKLTGYEEDPLTISTEGEGTFWAKIDEKEKKVEYRLSYEDLEGGAVTQAHIHFGGKRQSGGIIVFLCSNLPNPPAGTQKCPPAPATITGTIRPADVVGPANQGIAPGEFDEFLDAVEAGVTYANVHTEKYPNGEIRGQIHDDHDDH